MFKYIFWYSCFYFFLQATYILILLGWIFMPIYFASGVRNIYFLCVIDEYLTWLQPLLCTKELL